ncbi:MAG: hypothetical protein MJ078_01500 [Clostridia bacterium]|nr:hypothetical protein [Clostridia bacterium]
MHYVFDGKRFLIKERHGVFTDKIPVYLPMPGILYLGGRRVRRDGDGFCLSVKELKKGENRLVFQCEKGLVPMEGLIKIGDEVTPAGFGGEETEIYLLDKAEALQKAVARLEKRLAALEEKCNGKTLFS